MASIKNEDQTKRKQMSPHHIIAMTKKELQDKNIPCRSIEFNIQDTYYIK